MKRIGLIQIKQESNCFNPVVTEQIHFENYGVGVGAEMLAQFGEVTEVGGFSEGLRNWAEAVEPVGIVRLQAAPGGPLSTKARIWMGDLLTKQLGVAGPLDGILISLHGALMGEDEADVDGWILAHIRSLVGDAVPLVATLDLHAYITETMIRHANTLVPYHTFPHVDQRETGARAAVVLRKILNGARPVTSIARLPMVTGGELQSTFVAPLKTVFKQIVAAEARPGVLSAGLLMTQAWLDVPRLGWTALIVTDGVAENSQNFVDDIVAQCWPVREQFLTQAPEGAACVEHALACEGQPVVIADGADAMNSGACGDSVHLLRELIAREIPEGALTIMVDAGAVEHAYDVGAGASFDFAVGGKRDHVFSQPLSISGRVASLHETTAYVLNGHGGKNLKIDMGRAAVVRVADVTLLLVEKPGSGSTPMMYRCAGLEPKDFKIVIVKSPAGFRADFGPFAAEMILSDCPGCASNRFASLPYRHINRPLWPIDEIDNWRAVEWIAHETQ